MPEQIVADQTTRTEVLLLLGEPDGRGHSDRWFTYGSRVGRGGVGWAWLWGVAGTSSGGVYKSGDWETVRRVTIRFNSAGVVSMVDLDENNCTNDNHDCIDVRGMDISERVYSEHAVQLAAAGTILAVYGLYSWVTVDGPDCRGLTLSPDIPTAAGHELLITEHGILHSEMVPQSNSTQKGAGEQYSVLAYDDIMEVLPIERDAKHQWIPIRTRAGSCVYVDLLKPGIDALSPDEARALIISRIGVGSASGASGAVVAPK